MATDRLSGLSQAEAARRLADAGPNDLGMRRGRSLRRILAETAREPMFLLLMAAALLYLVLGDLGEGLFLVGGAGAAVGLVVVQEIRSERALAALRDLAQPLARVVRDGLERRIATCEIVREDVVLVGEGERLPADGVLVAGDVLSVDESVLTGESAPVTKQASSTDDLEASPTPGAQCSPHLFSGTLVVRGQGVMQVTRTGDQSALGRIGASLAEIPHEPTPLQRTAARLVALLGMLALGFCGLVAVAYGTLRGDWVGGLLAGVTVAISLIPEEFPMVLAVFLALGAWRLARHKVLARRSAVIETLGGTTVLCVDKTGTLTENRMQVARVWTPTADTRIDGETVPEPAFEVLRLAGLASAARPIDPMDKAVQSLVQAVDRPLPEGPEQAWPLRPERLAVVQLWRLPDVGGLAAAKGAPEAIFKLCRLGAADIQKLHGVIDDYAAQGLRVLGVASAAAGDLWRAEDPAEATFNFAGLLGFLDPVRADAPRALAEARSAGIKVVMITGDHPATALAVARAVGLDVGAGVLTGPEVEALPLADLARRLGTVRVFARIAPAQKLQIVEALKTAGEVVAMTGDGVNDAPALEAAHIGVAMGLRGSDVAREAADLVLLDDSFASIVAGVRLGRRIFANLRRALTYVVAIHIPVAGVALGPILLGLPPLLYPMHVVLLELVIDPTCALVFEPEPSEAGAMRRPPRRAGEALFGPRQLTLAVLQGLGVLAAVFIAYLWALGRVPEPAARGVAFVALVMGNLVLALTDQTSSGGLFAPHRRAYWAIVAGVTVVLAAVLHIPPLAAMFKLSDLSPPLLGAALAAAVIGGGWTGLLRPGRPFDARPEA